MSGLGHYSHPAPEGSERPQNLPVDGIKRLVRALAKKTVRTNPEVWALGHPLICFHGSSVKGKAVIDRRDEQTMAISLKSIVADADRLLGTARRTLPQVPAGSDRDTTLIEGAQLMPQLLLAEADGLVESVGPCSYGGPSPSGSREISPRSMV